MQLQQWPQAEHSILSALALSPNHVGTHVNLAQILARNVSIFILENNILCILDKYIYTIYTGSLSTKVL